MNWPWKRPPRDPHAVLPPDLRRIAARVERIAADLTQVSTDLQRQVIKEQQ